MALNPVAQRRLNEAGFRNLDHYYASKIWKDFRLATIEIYKKIQKWFCWACKKPGEDCFNLHHIDYENFMLCDEKEIADLRVLCNSCHSRIHDYHKQYKSEGMTLRKATNQIIEGNLQFTNSTPQFIKKLSFNPTIKRKKNDRITTSSRQD